MTNDDFRTFVALAEYVFRLEEFQLAMTKMFLARLEAIESRADYRERLARLPDCEELAQLRNQIDKLTATDAKLTLALHDALARKESDQEKLQAIIANMRRISEGTASA